jgi:hypothetical protein
MFIDNFVTFTNFFYEQVYLQFGVVSFFEDLHIGKISTPPT